MNSGNLTERLFNGMRNCSAASALLSVSLFGVPCGSSRFRVWQSRASVAREAHNLEAVGSIPTSATRSPFV